MESLRGWLLFGWAVLQAVVTATWLLAAKLERRSAPRPKNGIWDDALLLQSEALRQERASRVQEEFDRLWTEIRSLHEKASEHGTEMQGRIGAQMERQAAIDAMLRDCERRLGVLERVMLTHEKN